MIRQVNSNMMLDITLCCVKFATSEYNIQPKFCDQMQQRLPLETRIDLESLLESQSSILASRCITTQCRGRREHRQHNVTQYVASHRVRDEISVYRKGREWFILWV